MSKIHTANFAANNYYIWYVFCAFCKMISSLLFSLCWSPAGSAGVHSNLHREQHGCSLQVDPACDPTPRLITENRRDVRRQQRISQQEAEGSLSGE